MKMMSRLSVAAFVLLVSTPLTAQTAPDLPATIAQLQAQVTDLQRQILLLQPLADRIRVDGAHDAMIELRVHATPGDLTSESAILGAGQDSAGRWGKQGSLSWKWAGTSDPTYGYSVGRLAATWIDYADPSHPWHDDVALRIFGGQGTCFYCLTDDWRSAPGPGVVSFAHADVMLRVENGYARFLDQNGKPFWIKVLR